LNGLLSRNTKDKLESKKRRVRKENTEKSGLFDKRVSKEIEAAAEMVEWIGIKSLEGWESCGREESPIVMVLTRREVLRKVM
jgi:hypothetical protein